jgi:hypothetical protein
MAVDVEQRGIRPVWAGGAWHLTKTATIVMVDAQTGEVYEPSEGRKARPLHMVAVAPSGNWDGGFDAKGTDALLGRADHYYWWPRTYPAGRRYVYNHQMLAQQIEMERMKPERRASSWLTTGVASAVLSDWSSAAEDLDKAVETEPENKELRFYRGLILMAIRDLGKAASDFNALSDDRKRVADARDHLEILRGRRSANGLMSVMYNVETDFGWIPMDFRIGSEFLSKD